MLQPISRFRLILCMLTALGFTQNILAEESDELRKRVDELEALVIGLEEKIGDNRPVQPMDARELHIGGYYYGIVNALDTDAGDANGLSRNLVYLRLDAGLSEKWHFSLGHTIGQAHNHKPELAAPSLVDADFDGTPDHFDTDSPFYNRQFVQPFDNIPTADLNFSVEAHLSYEHNDALKLTVGRQRAPIGRFSRELYPMSWRQAELPQFMTDSNGVSNIFNPFIQGLSLSGKTYPQEGAHILSYSLFFADHSTMLTVPFNLVENEQYGARLAYTTPNQSLDIGLNLIKGKRENRFYYGNNRYQGVGLDLLSITGPLQLTLEYYRTDEGDANDALGEALGIKLPHRTAYLIEPSWKLNSWLDIFWRYDYFDAPQYRINNAVAPRNLGEVREHTFGLFFTPHSKVRLRVGQSRRQYRNLGNYEVDILYASASASF